MNRIDLRRILETSNLKASYVGAVLFPENLKPSAAVWRVCRGEALLNSEQIAKLSELLNVPIGLLFDDAEWRMSVEGTRKNVIQFRSYDYFAELDLETMTTTVSRNGVRFFEKAQHPKSIGLTDYLSQLTDLIIKNRLK
jgi:hypothetical protein